jgi:hypothetical protein
MRAYIGEADSVRDRIDYSARERGFWDTAVVITTSDETLTKGHVRYLEACLIEATKAAGRVALDNTQLPEVSRRRLPEANRANMETFLANLKVILPIVGLDLLKPKPSIDFMASAPKDAATAASVDGAQFEIRHRSGIKALAIEHDGEFIVLKGSRALKDTAFAHKGYARLKQELIARGALIPIEDDKHYEFTTSFAFRSPSAASAVVFDRNTNGRTSWHVVGGKQTYHEWQEHFAAEANRSA